MLMCMLPLLQVQQLQERLQTAEVLAMSAPDGSSDWALQLQQARAEADVQRQRCEELQQVCRQGHTTVYLCTCTRK